MKTDIHTTLIDDDGTRTPISAKQLDRVYRNFSSHWVGDGFPVRSVFDYLGLGRNILSPFLLLDYAGPHKFAPSTAPRGVHEHPHRGFETVTLVFQGEVEHRDSVGGGGIIGPGDIQWMTAGSGVMHEEMHTEAFSRSGGVFEVVQLWVNLPAKDKMHTPRYQALSNTEIPVVALPGGGQVRVIAGTFGNTSGAARTFTPLNLWDARLPKGATVTFHLPEGHTTALFVRHGKLKFAGIKESASGAELAVFSRTGQAVTITAAEETEFFVLSGQPINEPVIGYGPFVMNSEAEIRQAMLDVKQGRFGQI